MTLRPASALIDATIGAPISATTDAPARAGTAVTDSPLRGTRTERVALVSFRGSAVTDIVQKQLRCVLPRVKLYFIGYRGVGRQV